MTIDLIEQLLWNNCYRTIVIRKTRFSHRNGKREREREKERIHDNRSYRTIVIEQLL